MELHTRARATRAGAVVAALLTAALLSSATTTNRSSAAHTAALPQAAALSPGPAAARAAAAVSSLVHELPNFPDSYRVGALFALTGQVHHYCTASVVDSPHRNLVITAAHCVHSGAGGGYRSGLGFAPGYRDSTYPAGMWRVHSELVAPGWRESTDPDVDVAFLVMEPRDGRNIEDVVGGNPLETGGQPGRTRMIGYPDTTDAPVSCTGTATRYSDTQLRIYCPGFTAGTSGGPWLADPDPWGGGDVTGVIGGYQYGGNSPDISYSSYFDDQVEALYEQAATE
ncbi:trypsin-like peptidase domain-containing protein [Streptomyces sp. RB6PN25]|uniref:Trypsin-like peptidase domain-containing protein n=1 Tax=Streptomyces humicola TaxID=2953240 RepID=A0ABT1PQW4_9ACTN|nr:trypsin-like peptidase domain-containing protein [Streptomyces humicola]MCQ4080058.1 trypsin-like peptidase domain-containing protein [Streptomyces humicola]